MPVLVLLALATVAVIYLWVMHGSTPSLSINFEKSLPPSTEAATKTALNPEPLTTERQASPAVKSGTDLSGRTPDSREAPYPDPSKSGIAASEASGDYLVQVYSLNTREQADVAIADLTTRGYAAFSRIQGDPSGRKWHVVYTGPYSSLEKANSEAASIEQGGLARPLIVRRSSRASDPLRGRALGKSG